MLFLYDAHDSLLPNTPSRSAFVAEWLLLEVGCGERVIAPPRHPRCPPPLLNRSAAANGQVGAVGGSRGTINTFDLALGRPKQTFVRHPAEPIVSISFLPDGSRVASCNAELRRTGGDSRVFVWNPDSGIADASLQAGPAAAFLQVALLAGDAPKVVLVRGQQQATRPQKIEVSIWDPVQPALR